MEPPPGWPRDTWDSMEAYLSGLGDTLPQRPSALLVVSGHWLTNRPTVNVAARPTLLYDYYGFPEHTYKLTYPAPGAPHLASRVRQLLAGSRIPTDTESERGLDHGVFIPLKVMFPKADVPVLQLSLQKDLDPADHLAIGRALAPLRDEGVLIIGSGMSYHHLPNLMSGRDNQSSEQFDAWLDETLTRSGPAARWRRLLGWEKAPGGFASHPTPEHLLPLMVAVGAGLEDAGVREFNDRILGKAISGFRFG
ncbi:dioxygenase [Sphingosinicellaceae bacterium A1X5R2]|nr:dioxygenase [Pedomonas mirosovicensis]